MNSSVAFPLECDSMLVIESVSVFLYRTILYCINLGCIILYNTGLYIQCIYIKMYNHLHPYLVPVKLIQEKATDATIDYILLIHG